MQPTWRETFFDNDNVNVNEQLSRMSVRNRVAFATAVAERSLKFIDQSARQTGHPSKPQLFELAVSALWRFVMSESDPDAVDLRPIETAIATAIPDPDEAGAASHRAAMAVLYALLSAIEGGCCERALNAAGEAFAALRIALDITHGKAVDIERYEELERASQALQAELHFQIAALRLAYENPRPPTPHAFREGST